MTIGLLESFAIAVTAPVNNTAESVPAAINVFNFMVLFPPEIWRSLATTDFIFQAIVTPFVRLAVELLNLPPTDYSVQKPVASFNGS
jgi:transposase-like protein